MRDFGAVCLKFVVWPDQFMRSFLYQENQQRCILSHRKNLRMVVAGNGWLQLLWQDVNDAVSAIFVSDVTLAGRPPRRAPPILLLHVYIYNVYTPSPAVLCSAQLVHFNPSFWRMREMTWERLKSGWEWLADYTGAERAALQRTRWCFKVPLVINRQNQRCYS